MGSSGGARSHPGTSHFALPLSSLPGGAGDSRPFLGADLRFGWAAHPLTRAHTLRHQAQRSKRRILVARVVARLEIELPRRGVVCVALPPEIRFMSTSSACSFAGKPVFPRFALISPMLGDPL